jgi:uncharacterized protein YbbK (DUF523 family)
MSSVSVEHRDQEHTLILVSACLVGVACRYDGRTCPDAKLNALATQGKLVPFCPEVVGGLSTPRLPAEISGAFDGLDGHAVLDGLTRVVRSDGADVTEPFIAGAQAALGLAKRLEIQQAILKANSPSCGVERTYDGRFLGLLVPGDGVTAALLKRNGIEVITEDALPEGEA